MHTEACDILEALFSSSARIRLLRILLIDPQARFYLREMQARTGLAPRTVQIELSRLARAAILEKQISGNRTYYRVNERCRIVPELRSMFIKTVGVADVLRRALEPVRDEVLVAFIFGSFATGAVTSESDVDVMVIGDVSFGEVVSALKTTQEQISREINPIVFPPEEVRTRAAGEDHLLSAVLSEPKLFLIGDEDGLRELAS